MNTSYSPISFTARPYQRPAANLRFQGAPSAAAKSVTEGIPTVARPFIWLDKIKKSKGDEIVNIIINSIGTGLIAPIVIAFNKFNDEDKHTKIYSAMRQPISAVLAIITQIGINMPVPRMMDRLARRGELRDDYLGPLRTIHDNGPPEDTLERESKNRHLRKQYERVIKDPAYREKVAKLLNIGIKEEHDNQVSMAKKGRSSYPPPPKFLQASDVTVEDAIKYAEKKLSKLKYLTGFLLSVITLYPTCVLLNWVYPRFMKLFPSLMADDKQTPPPKHPQ